MSITDFFVVGIGLDIVGAWLVARGLLLPPPALKTFGTHAGIGAADVVDRARNRVDAQFGVGLLLLGFAIQLVGYLLILGGTQSGHGAGHLSAGTAVLVLSMLTAYLAWYLLHQRLLKRTLVRIAGAPLRIAGEELTQEREENIASLARYAKAAGWQRRPHEHDETHVKRVFGANAIGRASIG